MYNYIIIEIGKKLIKEVCLKGGEVVFEMTKGLKKLKFQELGLIKPNTLSGDYSRPLEKGYGKVMYMILVMNGANKTKYIKPEELTIKISNFKPIEFKHLLYKYKLNKEGLTDKFQVYGMNNGTDISGEEENVEFCLSDGTLIMEKSFDLDIKSGEVRKLSEINLNALINSVKKTKDKLLEIFVDDNKAMVLELKNNRFIDDDLLQPPPCSVMEPDNSICIAELVVNENKEVSLTHSIKITEEYTILKVNFFPAVSSSFEFSIMYKGMEIAKQEVSVAVPFFDIDDIHSKNFESGQQKKIYKMSKYSEIKNR